MKCIMNFWWLLMDVKTKLSNTRQSQAIRSDRRKTLKFTEVAQIREIYESCDACKKFTALPIACNSGI